MTLRRLHLHLNRYEQVQAEQAAQRLLPMPWEHAICLGGENVASDRLRSVFLAEPVRL